MAKLVDIKGQEKNENEICWKDGIIVMIRLLAINIFYQAVFNNFDHEIQ